MVLPRKTKTIGNRHEINTRKRKTTITNSNNKKKSKRRLLLKKLVHTKRNKLTKVYFY